MVLAGIGPAAIPRLMRHLHDSHEPTRAVTATALGLLKVRAAIPLSGEIGRMRAGALLQLFKP